MARYLVALGSSHIFGIDYISKARSAIAGSGNSSVLSASDIYLNNSIGTNYNCLFHNCAIAVTTSLAPLVFFRELLKIEILLGRIRTYRNARRTIDIDVLICLEMNHISPGLMLPHKDTFKRKFFVTPAIQALRLAGWPVSAKFLRAQARQAREFIAPISSSFKLNYIDKELRGTWLKF